MTLTMSCQQKRVSAEKYKTSALVCQSYLVLKVRRIQQDLLGFWENRGVGSRQGTGQTSDVNSQIRPAGNHIMWASMGKHYLREEEGFTLSSSSMGNRRLLGVFKSQV